MSFRFIHLADIHYDRESQDAAAKSIEAAIEVGRQREIDFWALSGDLFNRGIQNSAGGGFPRLLDLIARMLEVAPICAVSGTVTHDLAGCYEALTRLGVVLLNPGEAYGLYRTEEGARIIEEMPQLTALPEVIFLGMPEPTKEWLLAGQGSLTADETNECVKAELRKILLGMGALRAEHPEVPCVFLYHGAVTGASMANGQLVEGGISIGREDLALVGADYYALGHIHLAQQIPGLSAYYSGSAYPVNWGELDQKGFNLVDLGIIEKDGRACGAGVVFLPFPHAPRKKLVADWPHEIDLREVDGFQTWLVLRVPKGAECDPGVWLENMLHDGALPGSRVTVETIPTETVRAAAITEKRALRDKLAVYAEASGETLTPGVNEKADALEREAEASGAIPEGLHIRLRKLRLRGAIGIWKGLHVDEITFDLDRYDAGLIAMVGANGSGKTTLIENMHPYPCMLTRDGTLQAHFRLRDSLRELTFVDERTGTEYRALIQIDGANASGSCEYHLFCGVVPLTNGRKADYEEAIARLFGSLPLFLRSAFVSQRATKSNPDLAEATKGEKKAIFRELAGLDYLQAYAENAHVKAGAIEGEIELERARVNLIESQLTALPGIVAERKAKQKELEGSTAAVSIIEAKGRKLKGKAEELAAKVREQELLAQRIASLEDQAVQQKQIIALAKAEIANYQSAVNGRPAAEKVIADHAEFKEQEGAENERLSGIRTERERIIAEHHDKENAWHAACGKVEGELSRLRTEKARVEGDRKILQAQIDHLAGELKVPLKENCPTCGQTLPESTRLILHEKRAESERNLLELRQNDALFAEMLSGKQDQIDSFVVPDAPPVPPLPPVDQAPLQRIRAALAGLKVEEARKSLALAQEAATRIEETGKQREKASLEVERLTGELEAERAQVDESWDSKHNQAQADLEAARLEYGEAQRAVATLEAQISNMGQRIEELEAQALELEERKAKIMGAQAEAAEWRYLEHSSGADGIQALELDAMGPGIAEVANRLLSSAYGSRFAVEFRTTRIAGRGSKVKQVEDFAIYILDNEDASEQELSTLSGGEAVWIKRAIYDAFGIVRERSTGTKFLTVFADEADGALDPEAKGRYVEMMKQAHVESGRRHTLIITHSPEAQEMIGQRIVMSELGLRKIEV